jgi:hypothetical protein
MSPEQNMAIETKKPVPRKRGGQPGNINELSDLKSHQRSAKRHEALA